MYFTSTNSSMPYFAAFAAEPRLLHAAERRDLGGDEAGVDADHAVLERFGDAPDAPDVAAVEVRREPELGAVGELDHFGVVVEADQRRDGPERFLAKDLHVGRDAGQHRRLVERAAERVPLAAGRDLRAMRFRVGDVLLDLGDRFGVDQRALRDAGLGAGADLERLDALRRASRRTRRRPCRARRGGSRTRRSGRRCGTWR